MLTQYGGDRDPRNNLFSGGARLVGAALSALGNGDPAAGAYRAIRSVRRSVERYSPYPESPRPTRDPSLPSVVRPTPSVPNYRKRSRSRSSSWEPPRSQNRSSSSARSFKRSRSSSSSFFSDMGRSQARSRSYNQGRSSKNTQNNNRGLAGSIRKIKPVKFTTAAEACKQVPSLAAQVKHLNQANKANNAQVTLRDFSAIGRHPSTTGRQAFYQLFPNGNGSMHVYLSQLKFFDEDNPGTPKIVNGVQGNFQRKYHITSFTHSINIHALDTTDLTVYLCEPRGTATQDPVTYWTYGTSNETLAGPGVTISPNDTMTFPSDFTSLTSHYKMRVLKSVHLEGGQSTRVSHSVGPYMYDPGEVEADSTNQGCHSKYKQFRILVVHRGALAHPNGASDSQTATYLPTRIDLSYRNVMRFEYDSGLGMNYTIVYRNPATTFGELLNGQHRVTTKPASIQEIKGDTVVN